MRRNAAEEELGDLPFGAGPDGSLAPSRPIASTAFHAIGSHQRDQAADQIHAPSASRLYRRHAAHFPAQAVAEKAHRIEMFASRTGGDATVHNDFFRVVSGRDAVASRFSPHDPTGFTLERE